MLDENTIVKVTNRSSGLVFYDAPELNVHRTYMPGETKRIPVKEITAVCSSQGGLRLFYDYLLVESQQVVQEAMNIQEEPEYWLTEAKIPEWLVTSTIDEFTDALNYAPDGVKDLIKDYAVKIKLNDMNKRSLIKEILGFDVSSVISNEGEEGAMEEIKKPERKTNPNYKIVDPNAQASTPTTSKYTIINK